jgi:hypothetical protein
MVPAQHREKRGVVRFLDRFAAFVLVVLATVLSLYAADHSPRVTLARSDFVPFYCAGALTPAGADSDFTAPLEGCERAAAASLAPGVTVGTGSVDPAPVPGYDIALFELPARLPFPVAAWLWQALLLVAILATVRVLHQLTKLPYVVVAAALLGTDMVASFTYGQIAPLATLALALAAQYVERERWRAAALAALATLIQPQLGLPVVLALFLWKPRTRVYLAAGVVLLAVISLGFLGIARNLAYVQSVLPAQGAAEVPFRIQYSLSWLLFFLGFDEAAAARAGLIDYGLMLVLGAALAGRVARTLNAPGALVAFPAALVLVGGSYTHQFQLSGAVPFAAILAAGSAPRLRQLRRLGWVALILLAVPWQELDARIGLILAALALAALVPAALAGKSIAARGGWTVLAILAVIGFMPALARLPHANLRPAPSPASFSARGFDPRLASTQHGLRVREEPHSTDTSLAVLVGKLPLWFGLCALLGAGLAAGLRPGEPGLKISQAFRG